jgi:hypothetical protein
MKLSAVPAGDRFISLAMPVTLKRNSMRVVCRFRKLLLLRDAVWRLVPVPPGPDVLGGFMHDARNVPDRIAQFRHIMDNQP